MDHYIIDLLTLAVAIFVALCTFLSLVLKAISLGIEVSREDHPRKPPQNPPVLVIYGPLSGKPHTGRNGLVGLLPGHSDPQQNQQRPAAERDARPLKRLVRKLRRPRD